MSYIAQYNFRGRPSGGKAGDRQARQTTPHSHT